MLAMLGPRASGLGIDISSHLVVSAFGLLPLETVVRNLYLQFSFRSRSSLKIDTSRILFLRIKGGNLQ